MSRGVPSLARGGTTVWAADLQVGIALQGRRALCAIEGTVQRERPLQMPAGPHLMGLRIATTARKRSFRCGHRPTGIVGAVTRGSGPEGIALHYDGMRVLGVIAGLYNGNERG